jgi:hypothetical protein
MLGLIFISHFPCLLSTIYDSILLLIITFVVLCYCRFLDGTFNNKYIGLSLRALQPSLHFLDYIIPTSDLKNKQSLLLIHCYM